MTRKYIDKKLVFGVLMILIIGVTVAVYAQFSAITTSRNAITTGYIEVKLNEYSINSGGVREPFVNDIRIDPGTAVSKVVTVTNTGDHSAWVRLKADISAVRSNGTVTDNPSWISMSGLDASRWAYRDGWYYYNSVLEPGAETEPFINGIAVADNVDVSYSNGSVAVDIQAQAVQSANNGPSVMDAAGWPE